MATLGLLEGCQNIFEKGNESWKSYFSKWETLAGLEEDLPETIEKVPVKKQKRKSPPLKNRKVAKKKVIRRKKGGKNKNKTGEKVIERSRESANENLPEERDNNQLEMHLRTIFMDILKANKNKWEVFVVLSQTISHGDETIKDTRSLQQNHQLALSSEQTKKHILFRKVEVLSSNSGGEILNLRSHKLFDSSLTPARAIWKNEPFNSTSSFTENNTFSPFKLAMGRRQDGWWTPPNGRKTIFNFNSCPPSLQNIPHHEKIKLHPLALDYSGDSTPKSHRKTNNEYLGERNVPEVNITREEKRFWSLCLHKPTNGVGLNMENSNFVTPERNSSERKCFSENISQRKRRHPSKLFFDFWDDSDSENEGEGQRSVPRIGWQNKTRKIDTPEAVAVESDSESDNIFDRVKKVQNL